MQVRKYKQQQQKLHVIHTTNKTIKAEQTFKTDWLGMLKILSLDDKSASIGVINSCLVVQFYRVDRP